MLMRFVVENHAEQEELLKTHFGAVSHKCAYFFCRKYEYFVVFIILCGVAYWSR